MGHSDIPKIPDYKQFQVAGIKQLEELERALAAKGLKDPWIRNEAWRYNPGYGSKLQRIRNMFFRGFSLGLVLTVATVAYERTLGDGGHAEHGEHGEHGGH